MDEVQIETVESKPPRGPRLNARVALRLLELGFELATAVAPELASDWAAARDEYKPLLEKVAR